MRPSKYPTDLSDAEWACLKPCLLAPKKRGRGRPKVHSPRKILNAVFYLLKSGCPWRLLPRDFPPAVEDRLPLVQKMAYRRCVGAAQPDAVRAPAGTTGEKPAAQRGDSRFSVGQDEWGRRRSTGLRWREKGSRPKATLALVDTEGLVLRAKVHSAKVPDQDGIKLLLKAARERLLRLSHLWVDAGYQGRGKEWAEQELGLSVEVVHRTPKPTSEKIARI